MTTYTQIYYHIVFSTKNRDPVLTHERREELFRYIWGIVKNRNSRLHRINGTEDHLHIFSGLHPSCCLADLVRDIKTGASQWIRKNKIFPGFTNWQDGYGAFTHGQNERERLIEYIKGQQDHHAKRSFHEEYRQLLVDAGVEFDEEYLL
jgi:putative transposase